MLISDTYYLVDLDVNCIDYVSEFPPYKLVHLITIIDQAHTCKTLGIVTKPKSIASTHAQMRPRNIIHARAINIVLATTPSA